MSWVRSCFVDIHIFQPLGYCYANHIWQGPWVEIKMLFRHYIPHTRRVEFMLGNNHRVQRTPPASCSFDSLSCCWASSGHRITNTNCRQCFARYSLFLLMTGCANQFRLRHTPFDKICFSILLEKELIVPNVKTIRSYAIALAVLSRWTCYPYICVWYA